MEQLLAQVPLLMLIASRIAGVTTASPIFSGRFMVGQTRVAFTFLLALLILPGVKVTPEATTGTALIAGCVLELLVGLMIGFVNLLVFAAVQMAGGLLDMDLGFLNAQIMDPVSGRSEAITGTFFQMLGVVVYLGFNGHHWLLRGLAESYGTIPVAGLTSVVEGPLYVANMFAEILVASVQMVLPFMGMMLLVSVAMAGLARVVPQLHIFSVGMGVKAVGGLLLLAIMLPYFSGFLEQLFDRGHTELLRTLQLMR